MEKMEQKEVSEGGKIKDINSNQKVVCVNNNVFNLKTRSIRKINDLILLDKIGQGGFGEVYNGFLEPDQFTIFAVKKIDKKRLISQNLTKYFDSEISILSNINHKNVIKLVTTRQTVNSHYIVQEYAEGGSLLNLIKTFQNDKKEINQESVGMEIRLVAKIFEQIVSALKYLHSNGIIHRDLKPDNILLAKSPVYDGNKYLDVEIKLIDFGFSKYLDNNEIALSALGSPLQMPPNIFSKMFKKSGKSNKECFKYNGYKHEADIWSLGCILFEMVTGTTPFNAKTYDELYEKMKKGDIMITSGMINKKNFTSNLKNEISIEGEKNKEKNVINNSDNETISLELLSLIMSLLQSNHNERPSIESICNCSFLRTSIEDQIYISLRTISEFFSVVQKEMKKIKNKKSGCLPDDNVIYDSYKYALNIKSQSRNRLTFNIHDEYGFKIIDKLILVVNNLDNLKLRKDINNNINTNLNEQDFKCTNSSKRFIFKTEKVYKDDISKKKSNELINENQITDNNNFIVKNNIDDDVYNKLNDIYEKIRTMGIMDRKESNNKDEYEGIKREDSNVFKNGEFQRFYKSKPKFVDSEKVKNDFHEHKKN